MAVELAKLLDLVVKEGASDLHLTVGLSPTLRLHGDLVPTTVPPLRAEETQAYAEELMPARCLAEYKERGSTDFSIALESGDRFRVCVYRQTDGTGIALRLLPRRIMSLEEIGLPAQVRNLANRPNGLLLVTGPTGSGKTSTLAAFLDQINRERDCHIVTIEDPIEYRFTHGKSIMTQREVGVDVRSFADGIRAALRMDPDVILVGEMRDTETMRAAITAAETGHLVFGTLHTIGAAQTVNRIIDVFPPEEQAQIRTQLSGSLAAVITQRLVRRADGSGRLAAFEIMVNTPAIANLIREQQTSKVVSFIQTGSQQGMILMDDHLWDLFLKKKITQQEMLANADRRQDLEARLKGGMPSRKIPAP